MKFQLFLLNVGLNFLSIILLVILIALPFYFAKNISKVAGIKSETPFLVVSQVDKFPQMFLGQEGDRYEISFTNQFSSQAYLAVIVINNPTNEAKSYNLQTSNGSTKVFFGEDYQNPITQIKAPAGSAIPVSILSESAPNSLQTVEFTIKAK